MTFFWSWTVVTPHSSYVSKLNGYKDDHLETVLKIISTSDTMPGDMQRLMVCQWTHESQHVVLEVPDPGENAKGTSDSERCSWSQLLAELQDQSQGKMTDPTINSHELTSPMTDEGASLNCCSILAVNWVLKTVLLGLKKWVPTPKLFQVHASWSSPRRPPSISSSLQWLATSNIPMLRRLSPLKTLWIFMDSIR